MLALGAADHRHAEFPGNFPAHLRQAGTRNEKGNAHLRSFDDHFGGQAARRVENLVAARQIIQPHLAGDGVDGIVAADILDKHQDVAALGQGAAMHGAGLFVDRFVMPDAIEQAVQRRFAECCLKRQMDIVDFIHQVAEYRALAAAGGHCALVHAAFGNGLAEMRRDGNGIDLPVDLHRSNVVQSADQALVAQVAERQRFRGGAQRHQGNDLAFIDVDGERVFAGNGGRHDFAAFVDGVDLEGEWPAGLAELRTVHRRNSTRGVNGLC